MRWSLFSKKDLKQKLNKVRHRDESNHKSGYADPESRCGVQMSVLSEFKKLCHCITLSI